MQREATEVSNILWRERQLLELLVFKLEEEQLVLAAGRTRWLAHATREVETILAEIKRLELDRAVHVEALGHVLELGPLPTLRDISEAAPAPWDRIFAEHRKALLELAQEIDSVAQSNRDLLGRGQQATRDALATIGDVGLDEYSHTGAAQSDRSAAAALRMIDQAI